MKCLKCGFILPPGAEKCPICGGKVNSAQEDPRARQPYPGVGAQRNNPPADAGYGFSAGDSEGRQNRYATPAFHTYRKQVLSNFPQNQQANYQGQPRDGYNRGSAFMRALLDLPQVVRSAFTDPMGTLQGMIRREDRFSGLIVVLLSLLFAFLAGMILTRGALGVAFSAMSGLTGLELADSAASLNQGVGYLAGKVAAPVGGIAAVCQLIAALVPAVVAMAYLILLKQLRFSFLLASGFTAIVTLPNLIALLLASVFSLITPYLSLLILFFGQVVSYVLLCTMAMQLANPDGEKSVPVQSALVCLSELMKVILIAVIGGAMMSGVIRTLSSLTNSVSGLL
ncbi:MAG: hypothetical protein JW811_07305 [Clostridiales bacterium]|nr:hypothetical protein [Clostridiales bacterium]